MTLSLVHKNSFSITFQVSMDEDNPWKVSNLDKFLFYNCPECDVKKPDKEDFLYHALKCHSKARQVYNVSDENIQCYYCCDLVLEEQIEDHTKTVHGAGVLTNYGLALPYQCSKCNGAMESNDEKLNGHVCNKLLKVSKKRSVCGDRKSTRLNSVTSRSRMPSSA